jgi:oligopeptide transport system substrate-binding protein
MSARAGVGAAGLALVGCGDDDDDDDEAVAQADPEDQTDDQAQAQDEPEDDDEQAEPADEQAEEDDEPPAVVTDVQLLNANLRGEADSLDPQIATDTVSISVLKQIYAPLVELDEDAKLRPIIAEELPSPTNGGVSADGLTYTFKLREGLKWSDGTALVAQDLVNGAKRVFLPGSGSFYVDFYRVLAAQGANAAVVEAFTAGVEDTADLENTVVEMLEVSAPDDRTVVYKLARTSPVFLFLASLWPLYPIRQDIIDAEGDGWTEAATHVSNGLFALESWNHEQDITLVRNEHYHGEPAKLETVFLDMVAETNIAFLAYQEGELDVNVLGPEEIAQVRTDDALAEEFIFYGQQVTLGTYFNFNVPALADVKVRQALSMAVDRNEYAEIVLEGSAIPAYSWLPPGVPGHNTETGRSLYENRDVADAQALLVEAGFPGGEGLELEYLSSDSTTSILTAEWLQEQWREKLGVTLTIKVLETATYFAERNAGNYELTGGGWGSDYSDPQNWMPLWQTGGLLNSGDYSNTDYDALIVAADNELDNPTRIALYEQAQEVFVADPPFMPLNYRVRSILKKPYVKGLVVTSSESAVPGDDFYENIFIEGKNV